MKSPVDAPLDLRRNDAEIKTVAKSRTSNRTPGSGPRGCAARCRAPLCATREGEGQGLAPRGSARRNGDDATRSRAERPPAGGPRVAASGYTAAGAAIAATRCGLRRRGLEFGPSLRGHRQRPPARADLRRGGVPRSGRSRRCPGSPRRGQARATDLDPGSLRRHCARPGRRFDHVRRHRAAPSGEGCPEGGRRGSLGHRRTARHPDP